MPIGGRGLEPNVAGTLSSWDGKDRTAYHKGTPPPYRFRCLAISTTRGAIVRRGREVGVRSLQSL